MAIERLEVERRLGRDCSDSLSSPGGRRGLGKGGPLVRSFPLCQPQHFAAGAFVRHRFSLPKHSRAEAIDVATGPRIRRAVQQPEGIGGGGINQRRAQRDTRIDLKFRLRPERDRFARLRMSEGKFARMQMQPRCRRAAVKRVAQHRESVLRSVNADLMRAPRVRLGLDFGESAVDAHHAEHRLGVFATSAADVAFAGARDVARDGEGLALHRPVGDEQIFFTHEAFGELFRERAIGERGFSKDDDAARILVEPMEDGKRGPARLAMPEPVVETLAGERRRRVRVPARGLARDKQMLVFVQQQARMRGGRSGHGATIESRGVEGRKTENVTARR